MPDTPRDSVDEVISVLGPTVRVKDQAQSGRGEMRQDIAIDAVEVEALPADWPTFPAPPALAEIGERWFRASRTPVLSVPSVVIPHERNFVLNPTHPEFEQIVIGRSEPFSFDPRIWKR